MVGEPPLRDSTIRTTIGKESGFGGGSRIRISGLSSVRNEMRRTVESPWRELRWGGGSWADRVAIHWIQEVLALQKQGKVPGPPTSALASA